eukprot:2655161-Pleurochrysis_carterae.AAC.3
MSRLQGKKINSDARMADSWTPSPSTVPSVCACAQLQLYAELHLRHVRLAPMSPLPPPPTQPSPSPFQHSPVRDLTRRRHNPLPYNLNPRTSWSIK